MVSDPAEVTFEQRKLAGHTNADDDAQKHANTQDPRTRLQIAMECNIREARLCKPKLYGKLAQTAESSTDLQRPFILSTYFVISEWC